MQKTYITFILGACRSIGQFYWRIGFTEDITGVGYMNIRVHYPSTEEGWSQLNEKLVNIQAEVIVKHIDNLNCSYEEKRNILNSVSLDKKDRG